MYNIFKKGGKEMKEINARIARLRKELDISMEKFGRRIGITRSSVNALEKGVNNPSEQTIKLICKEFGVNEAWIRDGIEPIFKEQATDEEIAAFLGDTLALEDDDFKKQLLSGLSKLDDDDWQVLETIIDKIISKRTKK